MSEAMLAQAFVVGVVPLLSICLYQWDTSNKSRLERDQEEVAALREFVLQPLKSQSLSEGYAETVACLESEEDDIVFSPPSPT